MAIIKNLPLDAAYRIIDESEYSVLSVFDFSIHSVPFSFVRSDDNIYFASSKKGTKVDIFEKEEMIKLVFVSRTNVADEYTLDEIKKEVDSGNISFLNQSVFTNEYESAIADGRLELLKDEEERVNALEDLYSKYYTDKMQWFDLIKDGVLKNSNIYKVKLTNVTAKEKYIEI
ncbi:pyridoxamine 5'-phosphate oxidase family protein [Peptoniphilus asaccharolyticus]